MHVEFMLKHKSECGPLIIEFQTRLPPHSLRKAYKEEIAL